MTKKTHIFMPMGVLASFGIAQALLGQAAMAQTTDAAATPDQGVTEVVITAERRASTAQKTAISITAVSGEELTRQSKKDMDEIILSTPAVRIQQTAGGAGVFIRGIGTNDTGFGDPSINFNIDGIYQQDPGMLTVGTFDVNRVEVLRGPQGTLYGRNSTAGSLNLITNNPATTSLNGRLEVGAGNYNSVRTEGMLNVPLGDKFALRGAFFTNKHDGYVTPSNTDDADQFGGRLKFLARLTPDATLILTTQHVEEKGNGGGNVSFGVDNVSDPWNDPTALAGVQDHQFSLLGAQLDVDLHGAKLTAIASGTRAHRNDSQTNAVTGSVSQNELTEQKTIEVRLASDYAGPLSWVLGALYLDGDYTRFNPNFNSGGVYSLSQAQPLKSYGIFGQAKYDFSDTLHLTGGLRYSSDEKSQTNVYRILATGMDVSAPEANKTWQSTDYKLNLQKDLTTRSMLYATVSTGFKSGGFQTIAGIRMSDNTPYASTEYKPEKLLAYEIGSKNRLLNNKLQLNVAAYYYDYQNYQVKFPVFNSFDLTVRIENAGSATVKGVEFEGVYKISDADQIDGYATISKSTFGTFVYTQVLPFGPVVVDHSGEATPNAPDFTARIAYQHRFDLADAKSLTARIESTYSDGYWVTHERSTDSYQGSFTRSDASLRYSNDNSGFAIRAFVKNIEDVPIRASAGTSGLSLQAPRTYGIALEKSF